MPSRPKKEEKKPTNLDLTAFLLSENEKNQKKNVQEESGALLSEEVENMLLHYIKSEPNGVPRSQLYEWSKKKGIAPSTFYRALTSLIEKGLIVRKFDPSREEYILLPKG